MRTLVLYQCRHTFMSFPEVHTLGLIVALGDCWTYREYDRRNMISSPSPSEQTDPTYRESFHDCISPSTIFDDVNQHFGRKGFARLQGPASDNALRAVHLHLKFLCSTMFAHNCECYLYCDPHSIELILEFGAQGNGLISFQLIFNHISRFNVLGQMWDLGVWVADRFSHSLFFV